MSLSILSFLCVKHLILHVGSPMEVSEDSHSNEALEPEKPPRGNETPQPKLSPRVAETLQPPMQYLDRASDSGSSVGRSYSSASSTQV